MTFDQYSLQALISYLPHYLWYSWEGGRMKQILQVLSFSPLLMSYFHSKHLNTSSPAAGVVGETEVLSREHDGRVPRHCNYGDRKYLQLR